MESYGDLPARDNKDRVLRWRYRSIGRVWSRRTKRCGQIEDVSIVRGTNYRRAAGVTIGNVDAGAIDRCRNEAAEARGNAKSQ